MELLRGTYKEVQLKMKFGYTEDWYPYISLCIGLGVEMTSKFETCLIPGEQIVKWCFEVLLYELLIRHARFHSCCVANTAGQCHIYCMLCQLTFQLSLLLERGIKHGVKYVYFVDHCAVLFNTGFSLYALCNDAFLQVGSSLFAPTV